MIGLQNGELNKEVCRTETYPNGNGAAHRAHNATENVIVRPYEARDRSAIRRICCDTGFLGGPIEPIFSDREVFADLFTNPYLDYQPDWAWVAEADGTVVGYLLGSVASHFNYALIFSGFQATMKMIARSLTGRYARHPRTKHFIRWLLTHGYREQPRHPDRAAHLHFDIEKPYRGNGVGRKLWRTYETRLRDAGVERCYGAFFSCPKRRPELVYARFGCSVYDRKPTTIFPEISGPVEIVCVQKKLAA